MEQQSKRQRREEIAKTAHEVVPANGGHPEHDVNGNPNGQAAEDLEQSEWVLLENIDADETSSRSDNVLLLNDQCTVDFEKPHYFSFAVDKLNCFSIDANIGDQFRPTLNVAGKCFVQKTIDDSIVDLDQVKRPNKVVVTYTHINSGEVLFQ